jgi:hypothetical protein
MTTKLLARLESAKTQALVLSHALKSYGEDNNCLHIPINSKMTFGGYIIYVNQMALITAQLEDIVLHDELSKNDLILMDAALTDQVEAYTSAMELLRLFSEKLKPTV